tara:strand:- start:40 stop:735 length:696 start_codon:yes stop_codon:yes gene_type:complete
MSTYAELKQQILDYTETDSNVLTDTIINDFIKHSELKIFRNADLDVFKKHATTPLTTDDPFISMPGQIPNDFEFVRWIQLYQAASSLTNSTLTQNQRITLIKKDSSWLQEYAPSRATTGVPKYYANWDHDTILLAPAPEAAYTIELAYNALPTGLSSSNTTTWVSNNAPEMLLYACLVEAFKFLKNPQMVQMYEAYYKQTLQPFVGEQMGRRRRDEYRDGMPRITIPSENP